jgi:hypothetical protein
VRIKIVFEFIFAALRTVPIKISNESEIKFIFLFIVPVVISARTAAKIASLLSCYQTGWVVSVGRDSPRQKSMLFVIVEREILFVS